MKSLALKFALMAGAVTLVPAVSAQQASACAMRKVRAPVSAQKMVAKAKRYEERGETRAAIRQYERAMNSSRGSDAVRADAAMAAARLHTQEGNAERALSRVKRATELAPERADVWAAYSALQAKAGQLDVARVALDKARALGADAPTLDAAEAAVEASAAQVKVAQGDI